MYDYRRMTPEDRARVVERRRQLGLPWHSPPHFDTSSPSIVSAACYEHNPIIGANPERMTECEEEMLSVCAEFCTDIHAWCLLPNHYHILVSSPSVKELCKQLGRFHGRSSNRWNSEDRKKGRHVWYRCFDRAMRSERHFWASLNYIHNNAVHHGYVEKWQDWPWSSAADFLDRVGREEAARIWKEYPILDYGKHWDI